jgi:transcriptional regulator with XRE-family HTH domain
VITNNKLISELKNKQYRDAFVSAHVDIGIPHQIRILREQREWTQQELADHTGWKQAWIAKIENPNYTGFSLKTLKKLASAFDVAIIVRFVPISNLVKWELEISPESLQAVSYEKDPYFKPPVTHTVGSGGIVLGGEGIMSVYYPKTKPKAKIFDMNGARQKVAENKMDGDQKAMDMPLNKSMAGGARQ